MIILSFWKEHKQKKHNQKEDGQSEKKKLELIELRTCIKVTER